MKIVIPIDDWLEEYLRAEPDVTSSDAVVHELLDGKRNVRQLARMVIVAQERGEAEGLISPPKTLLNTGGAAEISSILTQRKVEVQAPNGNTYLARELVGHIGRPPNAEPPVAGGVELVAEAVGPEDDHDHTFHLITDERALELAYKYLQTRVLGEIWGRFLILVEHKADVRQAAEMLHSEIDEMVGRLTEPSVV